MSNKPPVSIDLGASVRAEIKTEIPKQSTGRFVDALTDIIRPFSEKRGLRADRIRLQREQVLLQIAQKARERIAIEGIEPHPLPNKFMVQFLETASLEETENKKLKEMWANLLVSSAQKFSSENTLFIRILGQLSSEEAVLFEAIMTKFSSRGARDPSHRHYADAPFSIRPSYV